MQKIGGRVPQCPLSSCSFITFVAIDGTEYGNVDVQGMCGDVGDGCTCVSYLSANGNEYQFTGYDITCDIS